jgi:hypothetical protein
MRGCGCGGWPIVCRQSLFLWHNLDRKGVQWPILCVLKVEGETRYRAIWSDKVHGLHQVGGIYEQQVKPVLFKTSH